MSERRNPEIRRREERGYSENREMANHIMRLQGAIFDMDGTLDSMQAWKSVGVQFSPAAGKEPDEDLDEMLQVMSFQEAAYCVRRYGGLLWSRRKSCG